jgi:hypothetical protein|tara:strand:- start:5614 stop:6042 length:429 start_codon:yes stop_codon:yes gene_type:complete
MNNNPINFECNYQYQKNKVVSDVTLQEVWESISEDALGHCFLLDRPFPHILMEKEFGLITIFDADEGWLEGKIETNKISMRCVYKSDIDQKKLEIEGVDVSNKSHGIKTQSIIEIKESSKLTEALADMNQVLTLLSDAVKSR